MITDDLYIDRTCGLTTEYHIMRGKVVLYSSCYEEAILQMFRALKEVEACQKSLLSPTSI